MKPISRTKKPESSTSTIEAIKAKVKIAEQSKGSDLFVTKDDMEEGNAVLIRLNGEFKEKRGKVDNNPTIFKEYFTSHVVKLNPDYTPIAVLRDFTSQNGETFPPKMPSWGMLNKGIQKHTDKGDDYMLFTEHKMHGRYHQCTYIGEKAGGDLEKLFKSALRKFPKPIEEEVF